MNIKDAKAIVELRNKKGLGLLEAKKLYFKENNIKENPFQKFKNFILESVAKIYDCKIKRTEQEIITISTHWDCECEARYINPKSRLRCIFCGAERENQPDSRANEMEVYGIKVDYSKKSN